MSFSGDLKKSNVFIEKTAKEFLYRNDAIFRQCGHDHCICSGMAGQRPDRRNIYFDAAFRQIEMNC